MAEKTTYASLKLTEEDHATYEKALRQFLPGELHPIFVTGKPELQRDDVLVDFDPSETSRVISVFPQGTVGDVETAVKTAKKTCQSIKRLGWEKRLEILLQARKIIDQKKFDLAAILTYEAGKTRGEAMAEVYEVMAMIDAYEKFLKEARCYRVEMNDGSEEPYEKVLITMEPLGRPVAVIVPFNFPFALCANMAMSAFLAGNPLIIKPSSDTPLATLQWRNIMVEAGVPEEACLFITGPGSTVGEALIRHPDLGGIAFTGSRDVGLHINIVCAEMAQKQHINRRFVPEMGGKNPTIVTRHADLQKAASGILRSALGYGGQKCSACSRVYVEAEVADELLELLRHPNILAPFIVDDPKNRHTFLGPLINKAAFETYRRVRMAVKPMEELSVKQFAIYNDPMTSVGHLAQRGYFVEPFLAVMSHNDPLAREEHFVPFVAVMIVKSLKEALTKANDTEYGLTAGIFTEDPKEIKYFFSRIEAGVVYANRRAGGTTGSWPTMQSFGGWKMSGLRGCNAFGPWYPTAFAREQCRTIVLK